MGVYLTRDNQVVCNDSNCIFNIADICQKPNILFGPDGCESFKGANVMDIFEFAKKLDGREHGKEITKEEDAQAKELGFVVVFGASDDCAELRGAIDDEVSCYDGGKIHLDKDGVFEDCECECKYSKAAKEKTKVIEAVWDDDEEKFVWIYKTDIPHATFEIFEDGEPYCRGIVFDIKALQ